MASTALPPYWNAVLREMTKLPEIRERSVVRSSVMPSAKYCWLGSLLRLAKGSTTIDRRGAGAAEVGAAADGASVTAALSRIGASRQAASPAAKRTTITAAPTKKRQRERHTGICALVPPPSVTA